MPEIGEIKKGVEVGLKTHHKHMFLACPGCQKTKWVLLKKGVPQSKRCASCAAKVSAPNRIKSGKDHWHWKGGRQVTKNGYIEVWMDPSDPFYKMSGKDGYVYEHRLVMARILNRCLNPWEDVHHVNHNRHDNGPENLQVVSKSEHTRRHMMGDGLVDRIRELEAEVERLSSMLNK